MLKTTPISWGLSHLLDTYPDLRERPSREGTLVLEGPIEFCATNSVHGDIRERFVVKLKVPHNFPRELPSVWELGGRIPARFHTNPGDGSLCLGSPLRLFMELRGEPTLVGFVNRCLVGYFYNFIVGQGTGMLPFGELDHGPRGLLAEYRQVLQAKDNAQTLAFLALLSKRRRVANKLPCPCRSGRRVGRCHNRVLNPLRHVQARSWFAKHLLELQA